jgi:group I intron endonuclease
MTLPPYGEVYVVTCSINGKQYVGQTTCGAEKRWQQHKALARSGKGFLLSKSITKYGVDLFSISVVDSVCNQEELDEKERSWIQKLNTQTPNGYNLKEGGGMGKHSLETREKMSGRIRSPEHSEKLRQSLKKWAQTIEGRTQIGLIRRKGKKHTPEALVKIGKASLGRKASPETKEKIRQKGLGRILSPETRAKIGEANRKQSPESREKTRQASLGRSPGEETRRKMRQAKLGRKFSMETRERMRQAQLLRQARLRTQGECK